MTEKLENYRKIINQPNKLYSTEKLKEVDGETASQESEPTIKKQPKTKTFSYSPKS